MSFATSQLLRNEDQRASMPSAAPDRRVHKRVAVALLGRFMRENKDEYPCRLRDISVGGISVVAPTKLEVGEFVVAYFDAIGGLRGTVVRVFEDGFAMKLKVTRHKQEKLAAELTWLINKEAFGTIEERRHERRPPINQHSILSLGDGFETTCKILDISLSGASLETEARPQIGAEVALGKQRALVRRHHKTGVGIQFIEIRTSAELGDIGN